MENIELLPEEVQPTTQELINQAQSKILENFALLRKTDYLHFKEGAGYDMSKYGDWKEKRVELRKEIDALESEVIRLKEVLIEEANEAQR